MILTKLLLPVRVIKKRKKMKTREDIEAQINSNIKKIYELKTANQELRKESILLSDDKQWFTEENQTITKTVNRKKIKEEHLIGRIHWNEEFKDSDTGEPIVIERTQVVRIDGKWNW
jgi:hypothetical protein